LRGLEWGFLKRFWGLTIIWKKFRKPYFGKKGGLGFSLPKGLVVKIPQLKAGDWIKTVAPTVKGGGGGRADFAQAGGKDSSKIEEAKQKAKNYLEEKLSNG